MVITLSDLLQANIDCLVKFLKSMLNPFFQQRMVLMENQQIMTMIMTTLIPRMDLKKEVRICDLGELKGYSINDVLQRVRAQEQY
jgi:hypothetical protein